MYGVVEAGGTKFICAVGDGHAREYDRIQFPTTTPQETLGRVVQYFQEHEVEALSVASFGPIEIRKENPQYGYITNTPKHHWKQVNFLGTLKNVLDVPIAWTTDVNGSAFGEYIAANQRQEDIEVLVYYTVGTGVGAGIVNNGKFIGSLGHPEMGDGFAIKPTEGIVRAPFDGTIIVIAQTGHAVGVRGDNGVEVLIHVGIDTVELNGQYFNTLVTQGQHVTRGQELITFDLEEVGKQYNTISPVIVTTGSVALKSETAETSVNSDTLLAVASMG